MVLENIYSDLSSFVSFPSFLFSNRVPHTVLVQNLLKGLGTLHNFQNPSFRLSSDHLRVQKSFWSERILDKAWSWNWKELVVAFNSVLNLLLKIEKSYVLNVEFWLLQTESEDALFFRQPFLPILNCNHDNLSLCKLQLLSCRHDVLSDTPNQDSAYWIFLGNITRNILVTNKILHCLLFFMYLPAIKGW